MDPRRQQPASMPQLCPCHSRTGWDIFAECYSRVQHAYETARHANNAAAKAASDSEQYKVALRRVQDELQRLQAGNVDLEACKADLQATKITLDECRASLEHEKACRKESDGAAEVAYEAAHRSGALADELRRELCVLKGEECIPGSPEGSGTTDLTLELVLTQQTVNYLEQMLQAGDPEYIQNQVQQSITTAEKLKGQVEALTDELQDTKRENDRLKALAEEGQDVKRVKTRKVRRSEN